MHDADQTIRSDRHEAPSLAGTILFFACIAVDGFAALGAVAGLYDSLVGGDAGGDGTLIFAVLLLAIAACIVFAFRMRQRGRRGLALLLAIAPTIPTLLAVAAVILFVATFTHHQ